MNAKTPEVRVVVFDMDGTITRPYIDFPAIRRAIGAGDQPILEYLDGLEEPHLSRARQIVDRFERDAAVNSELTDGAREVLEFLRRRKIETALVTRNNPESVKTVFAKHGIEFGFVVTPADAPPKPSPEPIRAVARHFGVAPHNVLTVGDFLFDVQAGSAAGARTVFLTNGHPPDYAVQADYVIDNLKELMKLLDSSPQHP